MSPRRWGRWALLALLLALLAVFGAAFWTLLESPPATLHIAINGDTVDLSGLEQLPAQHQVVLAGMAALLVASVVAMAMVVLPLLLVLLALGTVTVLAAGLSGPLLLVGLLLSPLWLLGWLLWRAVRGPRSIAA